MNTGISLERSVQLHSSECAFAVLLPVPAQAETFTTLRGALDAVAARYRIQVGVEYAAHDQDLQTITLDLSTENVDAVLNQLVNQKPDYVWSFVDSVYDVYPTRNPDSILDVRIHEFTMKGISPKAARVNAS